jgi:hypothetical protein
MNNLEEEFNEAMLRRYTEEIPRAIHYRPSRVIDMLLEHRALETVRRLKEQYPNHNSQGYEELWLRDRLDLSLDFFMLYEKYTTLFTEEELKWARKGLDDYGYPVPKKVARSKRPRH